MTDIIEDAMIGHNRPPPDAEQIRDRLAEAHAEIVKRQADLLDAFIRTPETVSDDNAGSVTDFIKQIAAATKHINVARIAEKEPYLVGGRAVDAFFNRLAEPLNKAKGALQGLLTLYERAKADEERKAREEAARKEREEARRLQAIADERDRAAKEREIAAKEREIAADTDAALDDAINAYTAVGQAEADARQADADARQADADAVVAERASKAKAAHLHTTRGDYGSTSSLRTFWDFADMDRRALDLYALRQHIPEDALEKAVRSYINAGGRELRGVRIFKNTKSVVR